MGFATRFWIYAAGAVFLVGAMWAGTLLGGGRMTSDAQPGSSSNAFSVAPAAAANTVVLDGSKDNGKPVQLAVGALLNIDLASNATTGFQWTVVEPLPPCLELIANRYVAPAKTPDAAGDLVGVPGRQVFEFKAVRSGGGKLQLEYRRSWEKGVAAAQVFQVTVRVE